MALPLPVLVIGGGIGGLCLAHGLKQAGVSVAVYERDRTPEGWQGYRIHINRTGSRALHECLPPALWDAFVATAGEPNTGFAFSTERMKQLLFVAQPPAPDPARGEHPVSRVMLRRVLLGGLDDVVQFGKTFTRYERLPDGTITAFFADGTTATGDVLVGADGIGSQVRQQYVPHAEIVDTGMVAVGGRFPLTPQNRDRLPRNLTTRLNLILPPRGRALFIAPFIRKPGGAAVAERAGVRGDALTDHVFWAHIARHDTYGSDGDLRREDGPALHRRVLRLIAGWHPDLHRLVAESDSQTISAVRLRSATPIAPWETTHITLLGDAIHAMTPLQGLGGNTALRDASLLCRQLAAVARGQADLLPAIRTYEAAMVAYGFDAVRASRQVAAFAVSDNRLGRSLFMATLRVADRVPALQRQMFPALDR